MIGDFCVRLESMQTQRVNTEAAKSVFAKVLYFKNFTYYLRFNQGKEEYGIMAFTVITHHYSAKDDVNWRYSSRKLWFQVYKFQFYYIIIMSSYIGHGATSPPKQENLIWTYFSINWLLQKTNEYLTIRKDYFIIFHVWKENGQLKSLKP